MTPADTHPDRCVDESEMGVPHITSFCWCMGLEAGSKIVGLLHLLASIVFVVGCSIAASDLHVYIGTTEDQEGIYTKFFKFAVSATVVSVAHVVLALNLLVSAYKRKTMGLRVWVIIMSILYVAAILLDLVMVVMAGFSGSGSDIFLSFLQGVLVFGFLAYCILCVNSYYLMLKSSEDMEGPNKTFY